MTIYFNKKNCIGFMVTIRFDYNDDGTINCNVSSRSWAKKRLKQCSAVISDSTIILKIGKGTVTLPSGITFITALINMDGSISESTDYGEWKINNFEATYELNYDYYCVSTLDLVVRSVDGWDHSLLRYTLKNQNALTELLNKLIRKNLIDSYNFHKNENTEEMELNIRVGAARNETPRVYTLDSSHVLIYDRKSFVDFGDWCILTKRELKEKYTKIKVNKNRRFDLVHVKQFT